MGILDAPLIDFRSKPLNVLDPRRDIPGLLGWWDAADLTGSNGSSVTRWADKSGNNNDLLPSTTASAPTLNTNGLGGKPTVSFTATQGMRSTTFGNRWDQPAIAQPFTIIVVAKAAASGPSTAVRTVVSSEGTGIALTLMTTQILAISASNGVYGARGGRTLNDDAFHVLTGRFGAAFGDTFIDGYLASVATTQSQGTNGMTTALSVGAVSTSLVNPWVGDVAEILIVSGAVNLKLLRHIHAYLASKRAMTTPPVHEGVTFRDITDSGGQAIRLFWAPNQLSTTPPLVIDNHQQGGTTAVTPGFYAYPMIYALCNEGFAVAVPNNHGVDSWSNDNACIDQGRVAAAVNTALGVTTGKTVLVGQSMGGCLSVIAAKEARVPNLKGIYLVDPAVNLQWMYANAYSASINTAFTIASAAAIPAGKDPATLTSGQLPAGIAWRAMSSTADVTVSKANNIDLLAPIIAGASPAEWTSLTHPGTHLTNDAFLPDDIVAFAKRCLLL